MIIAALLVTVVLTLLIIESQLVNKSVSDIAVKIHINGTRGKTTVTKYISAILRDHNLKTFGKVTGDTPTLLLPDGTIKIIKRRGSARVQEQFKIIRLASRNKADALVMECMSIDPALQKLESSFFKPNIYIITNIRDDHREKMGHTLDEQIESICNAIPANCKVIATKSSYKNKIIEKAKAQDSEFIETLELKESELASIPQSAHNSNIELAITATIQLGIVREEALKSILSCIADTEPLLYPITGDKEQYFLNAFSVNDTQSATDFLDYWKKELSIQKEIAVVFNTRSDRPLRTALFSEWIQSNQADIERVVLTGDHQSKAKRMLKSMKLNNTEIKSIRIKYAENIKDRILEESGKNPLILGIGNIKGIAYQIINEFSNAS